MSFLQRFDSCEKTVCKIGQTGHVEFIRLDIDSHNFVTGLEELYEIP